MAAEYGTWETKYAIDEDTEETIMFNIFNDKKHHLTLDAEETTSTVEVLFTVMVNKKFLEVTSRYVELEEDEREIISSVNVEPTTEEFHFDFNSLMTHEGCQNQLRYHLEHLVATNVVTQHFWDVVDDYDFAKVIHDNIVLEGLRRQSKKIESILEVEVLTVKTLPFNDDEMSGSIAQLRKTQFNVDGEQELEQECSICLCEFCSGMDIVHMPCKHLFHEECILRWLTKASTCPLCRHKMPVNSSENRSI